MSRHFYQPEQGHGLKHDPFNSIIAPRPIGWISSVSKGGQPNLAPYSFFNAFNYTPPIIGFSSTGWKDSVKNIEASGEFVWNLVSANLAAAMNLTSKVTDADEFALAGLSKRAATLVNVPMVAESLVSFECRLTQLIQLTDAKGEALDTYLVLGQVVGVHIDESIIEDGVYQTCKAQPITRGGGAGDYFRVDEAAKFVMSRPV